MLNRSHVLKRIVISTLLFLSFDAIWLGVIAKNFYREEIGHLMAPEPNWIAVIIFYLIYLTGLNYFVISKDARTSKRALLDGAFFGFICYSTYDFTNYATLNHFGLSVVVVDCIWGALATGTTSFFTVLISTKQNG